MGPQVRIGDGQEARRGTRMAPKLNNLGDEEAKEFREGLREGKGAIVEAGSKDCVAGKMKENNAADAAGGVIKVAGSGTTTALALLTGRDPDEGASA